MSNVSDLAVQAKENPALILPLWKAVRGLVAWWANKRVRYASLLYDVDDLTQSGYLAFTEAVKKYDPERGEFSTYLSYHICNHFAEVLGYRGRKRRPEIDAVSLNAPAGDNTDTTLMDNLADPTAEFADSIIERSSAWPLMAEIDKLPDYLRRALILTCYKGLTLKAAAKVMGMTRGQVAGYVATALRKIRNSKAVRRMWQDRRCPIPIHVRLSEFKVTGTSEVEKHILRLEEAGLL
jgi:RNA polymerase sigma factor (sigma-70 family)